MTTKPYIHYPYLHRDGYETIPVTLAGNTKILMIIRDDYDPEEHMVLFANPQKLIPVMDAYNAGESLSYLEVRNARAREGISAARANASVINPLPMASVVLCFRTEIRFDDGITRTAQLIHQKAEFVPLLVPRNHSEILQGMLGTDEMPPRPASSYIVRSNVSNHKPTSAFPDASVTAHTPYSLKSSSKCDSSGGLK